MLEEKVKIMRTIFRLLIFSLLYACTETKSKKSTTEVIYDNDTIGRNVETQTDSLERNQEAVAEAYDIDESPYDEHSRYLGSVPSDGSLPFGNSYILNLPEFIKLNQKTYSDSSDAYYKYIHIREFYNRLTIKDTILKPSIKKIEQINLGFHYSFINSIPPLIEDFRYQLPNMGPYKCFYASQHFATGSVSLYGINNKENSAKNSRYDLIESTSLILYDQAAKKAKVINIHHSIRTLNAEGLSNQKFDIDVYYTPASFERLFYIDTDKLIRIYDIKTDEETGDLSIKNDFIIRVSDSGEIIVKDSSGKIIKTYER